jgi:hypothetical protein
MFKLIKLCVYGLFAYFIYELVLGMTQEMEQAGQSAGAGGQQSSQRRGQSRQRAGQDQSQMAQRGVPVRVEDSSGAVSTRRAGRGVIHQ